MPLIIDAMTGTILDASECYIVFDDSLTETQEALLDSGSDSTVGELAREAGVPLSGDALEWILYGRMTSVSYGPSALREEARAIMEVMGPILEQEERDPLEWVINSASDVELAHLGQHILNDDAVWNGFRRNFLEALEWRASNPEPF